MRDLKNYAKQTRFRLIIGALLLIFIIGDGLIYLFYGPRAAVMGLICIGAGLIPVLLIIVIMQVMDWIVKRARENE